MADKIARLLVSDPGITIKFVDLEDGTYALAVADQTAGEGGAGGTVALDAATLTALETIQVGSLPAEALTPIAWVPRSNDAGANAEVPGFYKEITVANTGYSTTIPSTPRPKSLLLWFETSTADETTKTGRVAFARDAATLGTINNTDTVLGYHPPTSIEYILPADATLVWVSAGTAGRVARGMWTYE